MGPPFPFHTRRFLSLACRLLQTYTACALLAFNQAISAAPDEIQVYADDLNKPGEMELEMHTNLVTVGRHTPEYAGERPPYRVFRMTPEFSFGLFERWDMGIYLPTAYDGNSGRATGDGAKLRLKYLNDQNPGGDGFFFGLNTEVGYSPLRVDPHHWNGEFRGIGGVRTGVWMIAVNPILEMTFFPSYRPEIAIQGKLSREFGEKFRLGIEHYAGLGNLDHRLRAPESEQNTYLIMEYEGKSFELNAGIGRGWTESSDRVVAKAIFTFLFR